MWTWLASFLGGPLINGLITAYKARLDAAGTRDAKAADLAHAAISAEIETRRQAAEIRKAEGPWGPTGILMFGFGLVVLIYVGKVVVWDIVLGLGTTDAIRGPVAAWVDTIIQWLFGSGTVLAVARMAMTRLGR